MASKEVYISKIQEAKKQVELKYSKARSKSIGKTPLSRSKNIFRDQLSLEVKKFREYLRLVEDEQPLIKTCNQICNQLMDELEFRPVKSVETINNIMIASSKSYL